MTNRIIRGVSGLSLVCMAISAQADWPAWLGRGSDTVISDEAWQPQAIAGAENPLWKLNVNSGYSSFSITGNRLFTMGNDRDSNTDIVYCLNAETGEEIWRHTFKSAAGSYPGPRSTPAFADGLLYTISRHGDVYCLDAADGKVKWHKNVTAEFGAKLPKWGHAASPVIEGGMLLLNAGKHGLALNKKTGEAIWTSPEGICGYATPVIYENEGTRKVLIFGEKGLYAVDLSDGSQLWFFAWETRHDVNAADPVVSGKHVFISSAYGTGGALLDISGRKPREVWRNKVMRNHFGTFVLRDGFLYGISGMPGRGELVCMELLTGKKKWEGSTGFGNLIGVGNRLVVLNETGTLFVIQATPDEERIIAQQSNVLNRTCWTPPAFANQRIYCRNDKGDIACIDVSGSK